MTTLQRPDAAVLTTRPDPMRLRSLAAALAAVVLAAPAAQAQTNLSQTTYLTNNGGPRVATMTFDVLTSGSFTMFTMAPSVDANLWLFEGAVGSLGTALAYDDDACSFALCGPSGSYSNSVFTLSLGAGTYTLVGGSHSVTEAEARAGDADLTYDGDFTLRVTADQGLATSATSTVPEPGTWALMGTGLLGIAAAARRRRTAA